MNMFRDILILAFIAFGVSLWFGQPDTWEWPSTLGPNVGPYVAQFVIMSADARPWSVLICAALALALFMTRLKY